MQKHFYRLLAAALLPWTAAVLSSNAADESKGEETANALPPGQNLILQNIPRPPFSLVEEIERYTEFRKATVSDWHPTKKAMIIETRFGDTSQAHLVENPGGARQQLTFFRDAVREPTYQPATGDFFVFNKDKGGDEFFQKYAYFLRTKKSTS